MKILYAAGNTFASKIQLERLYPYIKDNLYVAAYKKSSVANIKTNWQLDCMTPHKEESLILVNENLELYYDYVKNIKPDLIISDFEYYTSHVGNILNIPVWQCSSSLLNYGTFKRAKTIGLKNYAYQFDTDQYNYQKLMNMLQNSNRKLIYSHIGDEDMFSIKDTYEWVRPYHTIDKKNKLANHTFIAASVVKNVHILQTLKKYKNSVLFSNFDHETYSNIEMKNIQDIVEYNCNLSNCELFLTSGEGSFLADAYYNNKFSVIFPAFKDKECMTNAIVSEHLELGKIFYDTHSNIEPYLEKNINSRYNESINYFHEKLKEF